MSLSEGRIPSDVLEALMATADTAPLGTNEVLDLAFGYDSEGHADLASVVGSAYGVYMDAAWIVDREMHKLLAQCERPEKTSVREKAHELVRRAVRLAQGRIGGYGRDER